MKRIFLTFIFTILVACSPKSVTTGGDLLYKNRYADRFELRERGDSLIFIVRDPWQGAQGQTKEFYVEKPLQRIICLSSTHTAFLEALGTGDRIVGVSGRDFITNERLREVEDVGYDNNFSYEKIVGLRPDAVLVYDVAGESSPQFDKLRQLGVPVIYIADYLEQEPLGRAEWVVAIGALVGRQEQAQAIFDSIEMRYNSLRDSILHNAKSHPRVMLNSPYRDVWYMPGDRSYMVRLLRDAGGYYLGQGVDDDVSRAISAEVAFKMMQDADYWFAPSANITSLEQLKSENHRFAKLPVVAAGKVFNSNKRSTPAGGSDFWESGALRADVALMDLAAILHPEIIKDYELYYFQPLE